MCSKEILIVFWGLFKIFSVPKPARKSVLFEIWRRNVYRTETKTAIYKLDLRKNGCRPTYFVGHSTSSTYSYLKRCSPPACLVSSWLMSAPHKWQIVRKGLRFFCVFDHSSGKLCNKEPHEAAALKIASKYLAKFIWALRGNSTAAEIYQQRYRLAISFRSKSAVCKVQAENCLHYKTIQNFWLSCFYASKHLWGIWAILLKNLS